MLLSKSDFKVARTCPTKLYFRKLGYPSTLEADEYMTFLADGGYMVETIAKLLHPDGVEIGFDAGPDESFARTMEALKQENATLFEATLISGNQIARVDILEKRGTRFQLIEVKAKSVDTSGGSNPFRGAKDKIKSDWVPYLEDVTFQTLILRRLFPRATIEPYLRLVDKSKTATIDSIHSCFALTPRQAGAGFSRPVVTFVGDVAALRENHCLTDVSARTEVSDLQAAIEASAITFAESIRDTPAKLGPTIGVHCRDCEYRFPLNQNPERNGFSECWGPLAAVNPHILDYYKAGSIGRRGAPLIDDLVNAGRASLYDIDEAQLVKTDGTIGSDAARQRIQRHYTQQNCEYIGPDLAALLLAHAYPLHFVDFETSRVAVPYHAEMRPYEQVAFQWSCHAVHEDGSVYHHPWINADDVFPNFIFARSLMEQIGDSGTIYTWSHHEQTTLKDIRRQMDDYAFDDPELREWLDAVVGGKSALKIVDLCALAKDHYFHPEMKGKLSLKYVLPAVWGANPTLHVDPLFAKYYRRNPDGGLLNPYDTLAPLPFADEELSDEPGEVVKEGTGAMRAYQEILYGISKNGQAKKQNWIKLLLQYCELDTAAMIMVWKHWRGGE